MPRLTTTAQRLLKLNYSRDKTDPREALAAKRYAHFLSSFRAHSLSLFFSRCTSDVSFQCKEESAREGAKRKEKPETPDWQHYILARARVIGPEWAPLSGDCGQQWSLSRNSSPPCRLATNYENTRRRGKQSGRPTHYVYIYIYISSFDCACFSPFLVLFRVSRAAN